jgi:AcrR family transcriptional regulator
MGSGGAFALPFSRFHGEWVLMPRPARSGGSTAVRLCAAERGLPVERRLQRIPKRLALPRGTQRVQVEEIQRSRLLVAAAAVIDEFGYEQTSVQRITARARVSRRTFYELFGNREACLVALLEEVVERVELELEAAGFEGLSWRERVRGGLWVILSFLDREPVLAGICVVQALHGGPLVLERREQILARLVGVLDEGRVEGGRKGECTPVTAEGLVGGAFGVVYARLRSGDPRLLTELLGELMGLIVLPYLGPAAARRERGRPTPVSVAAPTERAVTKSGSEQEPADLLQGVAMRLTYRTARVLEGIQDHPGASNRQVADHAGIGDPGQISRLLRRLEHLGLLENHSGGHAQGEPNEWRLTEKGECVADGIRLHTTGQRDRREVCELGGDRVVERVA